MVPVPVPAQVNTFLLYDSVNSFLANDTSYIVIPSLNKVFVSCIMYPCSIVSTAVEQQQQHTEVNSDDVIPV